MVMDGRASHDDSDREECCRALHKSKATDDMGTSAGMASPADNNERPRRSELRLGDHGVECAEGSGERVARRPRQSAHGE